MPQSSDPEPTPTQKAEATARTNTEGRLPASEGPQDDAARAYRSARPRWIGDRSRHFWLSLAIGLLAALAASTSFTDPLPSNIGGFVFVFAVVTAIVHGAIGLVLAFRTGWREAQRPTVRQP